MGGHLRGRFRGYMDATDGFAAAGGGGGEGDAAWCRPSDTRGGARRVVPIGLFLRGRKRSPERARTVHAAAPLQL